MSRIPLNVFRYEILPFVGDPNTLMVIKCLDKKHNSLFTKIDKEQWAQIVRMEGQVKLKESNELSKILPQLRDAMKEVSMLNTDDRQQYDQHLKSIQPCSLSKFRVIWLPEPIQIYLMICQILANDTQPDQEVLERMQCAEYIDVAIRNYPWQDLLDEVATVVRNKLLKLETKTISGRMANAMISWAKAIINTKQVNLQPYRKQKQVLNKMKKAYDPRHGLVPMKNRSQKRKIIH